MRHRNRRLCSHGTLWRGCVISLIATAALGCAATVDAPAAQGLTQSVPLTEVLARARTSPQVQLLVRLQLKRAKLRRDDVLCQAHVVDRSWMRLGGTVVGPYDCQIGPRILTLTATPRYTDASGARLRGAEIGMKEQATRVDEQQFRWRWRKV
jgi:hypothetical protein